MLGNLLGVHEHTGEIGAAQGGAQLLQHQGPPQLGARAPVLSPDGTLPQPAGEVFNEGAVAEPVEDAEVREVAAGSAGQVDPSV